jgi:hypothetical protein
MDARDLSQSFAGDYQIHPGSGDHGWRFRGVNGSIVWGYHTAVSLRKWFVQKTKDPKTQRTQWILRGDVERIDAFQARQKPLLFSVKRPKGAYLSWGIEHIQIADTHRVVAVLGPPEF